MENKKKVPFWGRAWCFPGPVPQDMKHLMETRLLGRIVLMMTDIAILAGIVALIEHH